MAQTTPPKILTIQTPTIRNERTLIWLRNHDTAVPWYKWDSVVTSIDEYNKWSKYNNIVGIILTDISENTEIFFDNLLSISNKVAVLCISQRILSLKSEEYWVMNYNNIINLDTAIETYPFINNKWDGTQEDAIAILALLLRYNRLIDCVVSDIRKNDLNNKIKLNYNILPNSVWLITQFFRDKSYARFKEIIECLEQNCKCNYIDRIVLINEKDYSKEWKHIKNNNKITQVITNKRLTYSDFIEYVNDTVPENVYTILSNADIYFGDSLSELWKTDMTDKMFSLLRWDVDEKGNDTIFGPRSDSQDSWIVLSNSIKSRTWDYTQFNFQLGQAGCDNAFSGKILRKRFMISNPSLTFKTYHLHNTNIRNYNKSNYIKSDIYINITPTYIIDTKQELSPNNKLTAISNELVSFEVKSSSMSNEITYCTMLEKEGRYKWEPSIENHYFEPNIPIYKWNNSCVTPNGLVYNLYSVYKGHYADDNQNYNYWKSTNIDILTPLQKCKKMVAIPFNNTDVFKHPDIYILNYISRYARFLQMQSDVSFWIPKQYFDYLEYFNFNNKINPVLFDENTATYADEVLGFLPGPYISELGSEDITSLRQILPSWTVYPTEKKCTIVLCDIITTDFVDKFIAPYLYERNEEWTINYVNIDDYASYDTLIGASLCIFVGGKKHQTKWAKLWSLPKECCVIEFQQELNIDGEFQHLAHISDLKSWILLLSKGTVIDIQEQITKQLEKWFIKNYDEIKNIIIE